MKAFKIVLTVFFGIVIVGNLLMLSKGEFENEWNYFALFLFILIEIFLFRSIAREQKKD